MEKLNPCPNIKAAVIVLGNDISTTTSTNITYLAPPAYLPHDMEKQTTKALPDEQMPLKLCFCGQYRKEKNLSAFLEVFVKGHYTRNFKLLVQGSAMHPDDKAEFEQIIKKYSQYDYIEFLHKGLTVVEWQEQIASTDVLLMPYSASRYRNHGSGMLFTAIGYKKPVIMSDAVSPAFIAKYNIGITYKSGDSSSLQKAIETFINTYDEKAPEYVKELDRAYKDHHPALFAKKIADLMI
jgi:glycosyltransferase involved in cell wall biosynthesis